MKKQKWLKLMAMLLALMLIAAPLSACEVILPNGSQSTTDEKNTTDTESTTAEESAPTDGPMSATKEPTTSEESSTTIPEPPTSEEPPTTTPESPTSEEPPTTTPEPPTSGEPPVNKEPTEGLKYTLIDGGTAYEVSGIGTATDRDICIPDTYNELPVTSIGPYAFSGCSSLTGVTFAEGSWLTSIGDSAFSGCSGLTSITFENTEGWYYTSDSTATSGTAMDVSDPATNATYLRSTYCSYFWKRS